MFDNILEVLNGLVTAINNLSLTMTNMIAVNCSQSSTCGITPPQPEATEGEAPPGGYSEYIVSEKCKAANLVVDDLVVLLNQFEANSVDDIAALGIGALAALFALVVALLPTGPLALAVGVVGTIGALIAFFLVQTVDLPVFVALIESLRDDLVCALYQSPDNATANTEFIAVLSGGGATASALGLLNTINFVNGLTLLFFSKDDISAAWQARLDGYTAITDCDACPPPCPNFDGTYYYPCTVMAWCEIASPSEWVAVDTANMTGVPDGIEGYFVKQAAAGPDGDCLGDKGQMYLTFDFGIEITGHKIQVLTRGNMTDRLPIVAWSNLLAAYNDPAHADWNNPAGSDSWYTPGATLTWSIVLESQNLPYRYLRLKMGAETGDPNGDQLFIDAVRNNPN
jgi:hypothetical protein